MAALTFKEANSACFDDCSLEAGAGGAGVGVGVRGGQLRVGLMLLREVVLLLLVLLRGVMHPGVPLLRCLVRGMRMLVG